MGLTTSCEAIERQASQHYDSDPLDSKAERGNPDPPRKLNVTPEPCEHGGTDTASRISQATKRKQLEVGETPKKKKRQKSSGKPPGKVGSAKKPKATPKKKTPVKKVLAPAADIDLPTTPLPDQPEAPPAPTRTPVNSHRAKILVGKQALAAIKEGTRIYIKSGEGNGGDTWWDSGVIQKIHERGKPFEVEWQEINNRGEEVDTDVERRIGLPVTYSLAGSAAEAILAAPPGTQAAALARKSVLAKARIGSWCISHPEEPWGMLDPFGEDSSTAREGL